MYDTTIGRFTTMDDFEASPSQPTHLNKYLYAGADPVNNWDPSGHDFSLAGFAVSAGISGLLSATVTGAYGYAKGWSTKQIAKAATYSFFVGAFAGAAAYGLAWGLAAGSAISAGLVASEAGAYSAVGWTAVGLIGGPTTLGLAISNYVDTANNPNADSTDRAFANFNLAISAFVFAGVHAQAIASLSAPAISWEAGPELTAKINEIKALPPDTQLTADQLAALQKNIQLLKGSVTNNPGNTRVAANVSELIQSDPRFTNLTDAQRQAWATQIAQTIRSTNTGN